MKYFDEKNEYYSTKIDDTMRDCFLKDKYIKKKWLSKDEDFDEIKQIISSKLLNKMDLTVINLFLLIFVEF